MSRLNFGRGVVAVMVMLPALLGLGAVVDVARPWRTTEASAPPPAHRALVHVPAHEIWRRGDGADDTLFAAPTRLVRTSAHVVVFDAARRRLLALRAADGRIAWQRDSIGDSPLVVASGDDVVVVDRRTRIASRWRAGDGRALRAQQLGGGATILAVCPLANNAWIIATEARGDSALTRIDADGALAWHHPWPWTDLATSSPLARQFFFAASPDGASCHAISALDGRMVRIAADGAMEIGSAEESLPPPEVASVERDGRRGERLLHPAIAAMDIAQHGDTVVVLAMGRTVMAGRLLDRYVMPSGAYLDTRILPWAAASIALSRDGATVAAITLSHGRPVVRNVRLSGSSP